MEFNTFDDAYLARLRSGDYRTEEHFVAYFSRLIQIKLRARVRTSHEIEDIRQETFVRVFAVLRNSDGLRQADCLGSFVNSVCKNVLLEYYRSSARSIPIDDEGDKSGVPDTRIDVLATVLTEETVRAVWKILDALSERDRQVLKEVFLYERDRDEVCRDFGVDRDYLRVLLHRAKNSFRALCSKNLGSSKKFKQAISILMG